MRARCGVRESRSFGRCLFVVPAIPHAARGGTSLEPVSHDPATDLFTGSALSVKAADGRGTACVRLAPPARRRAGSRGERGFARRWRWLTSAPVGAHVGAALTFGARSHVGVAGERGDGARGYRSGGLTRWTSFGSFTSKSAS